MATDASYTPGRFTRPETEYMRVPPWVLVPRLANHPAPRLMMCGRWQMVLPLLTIVGAPNAPLMAVNGGLSLGQPFRPSSVVSSPVPSPHMYGTAQRGTRTSYPRPRSPATRPSRG